MKLTLVILWHERWWPNCYKWKQNVFKQRKWKFISINLFVTLTEEEPRFAREVEEDALSEGQEPIANDLSEGDEQAEGAPV